MGRQVRRQVGRQVGWQVGRAVVRFTLRRVDGSTQAGVCVESGPSLVRARQHPWPWVRFITNPPVAGSMQRAAVVLAALAMLLVALAGCTGDDAGDGHDHDDHEHDDGHDGMDGNDTEPDGDGGNDTVEPNLKPALTLTITDEGGNETDVVLSGGNLTFDGAGSTDPDGVLEQMALQVVDANGTTRFGLLYDGAAFTPVAFAFHNPGRVAVAASGVDDDGDFELLQTSVYVNDLQSGTPFLFNALAPAVAEPTTCAPPVPETTGNEGAANAVMAKKWPVTVKGNATQIVATLVQGEARFAICDPDGTVISGQATDEVATNEDTTFEASSDYYVMVYSDAVNNNVNVDALVRYDPLGDADAGA